MAENCNTKNPLLRDGTSQQQRLLNALLPNYVSVDERSMQDLIAFTENFSPEVNFYQDDNTVPVSNGHWQSFFKNQLADKKNQATQPHYALFIAFLELFKLVQDDLNTITQRHLNFYYKEVLKLKERDAVPDQVFVIFKLAQNIASHLLPKETALDAKKDATDVDLVYNTTANLVVNKAQVKELKSLFYNKNYNNRLYASPLANSANGQGEELEGDEKKWTTFGSISDPTLPLNSPLIKQMQADVGFAFATPLLFLAEGQRVITIELKLDNISGLNNIDLSNAFNVYFSGEEEWISALPDDSANTAYADVANSKIVIHRKLLIGQPAIVSFNPEKLTDRFVTEWPVVKILLNTNDSSAIYVYKQLKNLAVTSAKLSIDVEKVKNLLLQNDQSVLDASKPFQPFGNRPVLGSGFYIGSNEIFSKNISSVNLHIDWQGLPLDSRGFDNYYANYIPNKYRGNGAYRANIAMLDNKIWTTLIPTSADASRLFDGADGTQVSPVRDIAIGSGALAQISKVRGTTLPISGLDNTTQRGFLRMQLQGSDFGHQDFQNSFATQAMKAAIPATVNSTQASQLQTKYLDSFRSSIPNAQSEVTLTLPGVNFNPLPNEPYTPVISDIYLDYKASVEIDLTFTPEIKNQSVFNNRVDKYFHVEPFGVAEFHPYLIKTFNYTPLLPVYNDEGSLYIGLSDMDASQVVSILFKVAEGTANPDLPKQTIKWSYMSNNEWYPFGPLKVISDTTNGFLTSGIVLFDISKTATNNNTALPAGMHWLKASVEQDALAVCDMIEIRTQAVLAEFKDNTNDPAHYAVSLPPKTINSLVDGEPAIETVEQPYASFGGKIKEQNDAFYTRISERLRHKNRSITLWDYEHMVLEQFPSIYKIKCINHAAYNSPNDFNEIAPGHVSLVTVSNVRNHNAVDPLRPKTSLTTLSAITEYLKTITPPYVEVHVKNPVYEEIRMDFTVRFHIGFDNDFYRNKLDEDLRKFLAPWAYEAIDIAFGGTIHKSVILKFVEDQEYVNFVTCFRMDHIHPGGILLDIEEAKTVTSASILTSAPAHTIHVMETDDCGDCKSNIVGQPFDPVDDSCECDDGAKQKGPYGIGAFIVNQTFIVGNGTEFTQEGIGYEEVGQLEIT